MIAVIFEVIPHAAEKQTYLNIAADLHSHLSQMEGFISIERFQSLSTPDKFLSLSFWRDEQAVLAWRNLQQHREAQARGRASIFAHYRLRVAQVMRDYGLEERAQCPIDSLTYHQHP